MGLVIVLAVVQGLTEYLPVSSSGHLRLAAAWFGVEQPQTMFDIVLHVGTLIPVVVIYRREIGRMARAVLGVLRGTRSLRADPDARLVGWVLLASVPTGILGVGLGGWMESVAGNVTWVAVALGVNGIVLLVLGRLHHRVARGEGDPPRGLDAMGWRDALVIGTVQGCAVFRGISRSGSTITAGMWLGIEREAAAAFSFLLAIPAILGALVLKLGQADTGAVAWDRFLLGGAVAAVVGTAALVLLLRLLRRGQLQHFAWYCFAVAALTLIWR